MFANWSFTPNIGENMITTSAVSTANMPANAMVVPKPRRTPRRSSASTGERSTSTKTIVHTMMATGRDSTSSTKPNI